MMSVTAARHEVEAALEHELALEEFAAPRRQEARCSSACDRGDVVRPQTARTPRHSFPMFLLQFHLGLGQADVDRRDVG